MRILLDTNVLLDVLLKRGDWLANAETIWQAGIDGRLAGCVTASSVTDIYYISRRLVSMQAARRVVRQCLDCLDILSVDNEILEHAYALANDDFEDALQIAAATRDNLDAIVTRDPNGFSASPINVLSPAELITRLQISD